MTDDIRMAIRLEMTRRRLTGVRLAKMTGTTPRHLSEMLNGRTGYVPDTWRRVFDTLGLELTVKAKGD